MASENSTAFSEMDNCISRTQTQNYDGSGQARVKVLVTMYNFLTIKDAADVAIDTMLSGIQIRKEALWVCLAMKPNKRQ